MLIKICGIKRLEDIEYVNELKPDYIGFVFAKSKRQIDIYKAIELKDHLDSKIKVVGVFRNDNIDLIKEVLSYNIIDLIQLHGDESDDYIKEIKKITNKPIIKAYRDSEYAKYSLYDSIDPGQGIEFDYKSVKSHKQYFLAGGINISNIDEALKQNPYCIDVSSGVETDGIKDYYKMKELIKRCKNYE